MAILSSKCHGIVARSLLAPQSKNGSPFEEPFWGFCYLTLFTFMRRSRTRRHMETKKVMMK